MKPKKDDLIAPIIVEMLRANENALNVEMAEEATKRLGFPVDRNAISRVRNKIGLGMFHQIARHVAKEIVRSLK